MMAREAATRSSAPAFFAVLGKGICSERQVAHFAGRSERTSQQAPTDDQASADAGPDRDVDEIINFTLPDEPMLPKCGKIDVVLDHDLNSQRVLQQALHVNAVKSGNVGNHADSSGGRIRCARNPHNRRVHLLRRQSGLFGRAANEVGDLPNHGLAALSIGRANGFGDHNPGEIANGHAHLEAAQIDTRNRSGVGRNLIHDSAPADMPFSPADCPDPSVLLKPDTISETVCFDRPVIFANTCPGSRP